MDLTQIFSVLGLTALGLLVFYLFSNPSSQQKDRCEYCGKIIPADHILIQHKNGTKICTDCYNTLRKLEF